MSEFSDSLQIRPATNQDVPAIRELVFSVLREYGLEPQPDGTDADIENIEAAYLRRGGVFEVVQEPDGRIVGTVGLCPIDAERVELRKMYLEPEVRGHGLGKRLLKRMLAAASRLEFREVWLETNSVLTEAVALYEKFGFTPGEKELVSPRCDQVYRLRL